MNFIGSKKTKCLIIHGFGGGIYEVKTLAEYLNVLGYHVVCPVLKGHSVSYTVILAGADFCEKTKKV